MRTTQIILHFLSVLLTPLLLVSCLTEEVIDHSEKPNCTVLYYLANNELSASEMQEKMEALTAEWGVDGNNYLLVFQDARDGNTPCLLRIHADMETGKGVAEVVATYDNTSFLPENIFAKVLTDVTTLYPAPSYGLILCSQSTGWLPGDTGAVPRSVLATGNRSLNLLDFASVIPDGQFNFIIFEGDHMAGVEVAYELKEKTEYIVASAAEIASSGFTPVYDKLLTAIYRETPRLAQFAADYYEYCNSLSGDRQSATVSVIRTSELAPLKSLLNKAESHVEHWEYIDRSAIQHFDRRTTDCLFYDLADYIQAIGTEEENAQLTDILSKAVVYQAATGQLLPENENGFDINRHCGLTIYIPVVQFTYLNGQRQKLKLFAR